MKLEEHSVEKIGEFIRARRRQLKVTQKDLAMASNTGLRFIIDLERGKSTCQIGKFLIVLQTLGIKMVFSAPNEK